MSIGVVEGALFTGDADKAGNIGLFTHVVVMSIIVIGGVYGLLFLLPRRRPGQRLVVRLGPRGIGGVVVGAAPKMHPGWPEQASPPRWPAAATSTCPIPDFRAQLRKQDPAMFMVGHLLYGAVLGPCSPASNPLPTRPSPSWRHG